MGCDADGKRYGDVPYNVGRKNWGTLYLVYSKACNANWALFVGNYESYVDLHTEREDRSARGLCLST